MISTPTAHCCSTLTMITEITTLSTGKETMATNFNYDPHVHVDNPPIDRWTGTTWFKIKWRVPNICVESKSLLATAPCLLPKKQDDQMTNLTVSLILELPTSYCHDPCSRKSPQPQLHPLTSCWQSEPRRLSDGSKRCSQTFAKCH